MVHRVSEHQRSTATSSTPSYRKVLPPMNGIQTTVVGNLTRDPEVQTVGSGATLAKFTIASERSWKNESTGEWDKAVSYVDVITWRFTAEDVERLLEKGVRVVVTGRFDQVSWEDKDTGKTRTRFELTADEVGIAARSIESFERRRRGEDNTGGARQPARTGARPAPAARPAQNDEDIWG